MRFSKSAIAIGLAITISSAYGQLPQTGIGGVPGGSAQTQFFVSSSGSDANPGTQAQPWQTITKVNSRATAGSQVHLNGGDTFTTTTGITADVSVMSYGTGQATVSSGNSAACVTETNPAAHRTINNFICTGGGALTNTTDGILITNPGTTLVPGPTITNMTISGYGRNCIWLQAQSTGGISGTTISGNTAHDCTENSATAAWFTGGIVASNGPNFTGCCALFTDLTITNNIVYNVNGYSGAAADHWTGMGIWVQAAVSPVVQGNLVHDTGLNSTTTSGSGCYSFNNVSGALVQFNEGYNCLTGNSVDGDGIDFDGNVTNSVMQYNYVHDCTNYGVLGYNYSGAGTWSGNTIRFNISVNCGTAGAVITDGTGTDAITSASFYNNTLYGAIGFASHGPVTAQISNNIFYGLAGVAGNASIFVVATGGTQTFTGNDYYGNGDYTWGGTSYASFSAWQTATGQEKISGVNVGYNVEPRLLVYGYHGVTGGYVPTSLTEYQLQTGSPMLSAGLNLNTQYGFNVGTQDYFGASITASALPIGAGQQVAWAGTSSATCTQATTLLGRLSSATTAEQQADNGLICGAIVDGWWSLEDVFYAFAASNSTNALLNWVSTSYGGSAVGPVTFTANKGYTGVGPATTGYLTTPYNPSTAGGNFTQNSAHFGVYVVAAGTRSGIDGPEEAGALGSDANITTSALCPDCNYIIGKTSADVNEANSSLGIEYASSTILGMWTATRTAASAEALYLNSASVATATNASTANVASNFNILAAACSPTDGCFGFSPDTVGYADFGGGFTASLAALQAYRMNAHATALGINQF